MDACTSSKRVDDSSGGPSKKRRKGATRLSCAECRRLKLRCDRTVPCSSCVKRGCGAICPDGSLTTGQGNRFVLASTQELHEKISELANRVRELEDALRSSHAQLSLEQHPLLSDDLLRIKAPLQREPPVHHNSEEKNEDEQNPDVADAFGSLSISQSGRAKYFGSTANSWYFLQNEHGEGEEEDIQNPSTDLKSILPQEVLAGATFAAALPKGVAEDAGTDRLRTLFWYLPPAETATKLRNIYFRNAAWMYSPITPQAFDEEVYSQFYDPHAEPLTDDPLLSHRLSLMFLVLAIGSLMDTSQPAYNIEAEKYHYLSRAALFQDSLFEEPTITAVQALYLMSFYLFLADRHATGSGIRWLIMGLAIRVGQSIGLHRDSGRWNVGITETQRRRELFWEMFTYDSLQCLTFGRPPSFSLAHVDCKMPFDVDGPDEQSFHNWKHRFTSECMSIVQDQAFGAKNPTYAVILQLDRKLRAFPVPPVLQVAGFGGSQPRPGGFPETVMLTLQRHIVLSIRETVLLYLHRSFFARAVSEHPKDPLGSPYGTSVIAAYRSAGSLIALMRNLHSQLKEPSERLWFLWAHIFSCSIVLGSIVTRCPSMSLAPSALVQLDSACELFSKAAHGFRAEKVLSIMVRLQRKAQLSLAKFRNGNSNSLARPVFSAESAAHSDDDELTTLGGKTRLVSKKEERSPLLQEQIPSQIPSRVVPLPLTTNEPSIHPNVVEYLRTFAPTTADVAVAPHKQPLSDASIFHVPSIPESQYPSLALFQQYPERQQFPEAPFQPRTPHTYSPLAPTTSDAFPQYFPVYDYGTGSMETHGDAFSSMHMNMPIVSRHDSNPPEENMHTTWQDFVTGLGMT